jgi:CelD/BcsL family acetyltransferase involved in cellulose biosynthesis
MLQEIQSASILRTALEEEAAGVIYYHPVWLDLIARLNGYSIVPLTTSDEDGRVTGYLPLCFMRSSLTGKRLVSLPYSDHCPLLAKDEASANKLIERAIRLADQLNVRYLELRTGLNDVLANRSELTQGNHYVRWQLPLYFDADVIWSKLWIPVQQQINEARKLGITVRCAQNRLEAAQYYWLHLQRSKREGVPPQPQRFFEGLWDAFGKNGAMQILLAEYNGNCIAGMVLLASGTTVRYAYGASDEKYLSLAPNNLLMWEAIAWGCQNGYMNLDMGRTAIENEGLMEFKRRWGAIAEPLPYYYYPQIEGLASTSEQSKKFRLLTSTWRKLPLQLSGPLGGLLYRHLG